MTSYNNITTASLADERANLCFRWKRCVKIESEMGVIENGDLFDHPPYYKMVGELVFPKFWSLRQHYYALHQVKNTYSNHFIFDCISEEMWSDSFHDFFERHRCDGSLSSDIKTTEGLQRMLYLQILEKGVATVLFLNCAPAAG